MKAPPSSTPTPTPTPTPPPAYGAAAMVDMQDHVRWSESSCLNKSARSSLENVLKQGLRDQAEMLLESDADEQLLLTISFATRVKLHSLELKAPADGRAPVALRLFVNPRAGFDFDDAGDATPEQVLEVAEEKLGERLELRFVKFQSVDRLVVFIEANHGDTDTSAISSLKLWGATVHTTNMKEFKRVAGEVGEVE
eukprot:CAMPEP_0183334450 /NCGR_PEP_ID=MMETSP0164_2-20130417/3048_1 /TAXON_ID=221442 /ORGANISM="Coccolithus pelagicus ssp braarudi, Strain PLY182g" /LENGTH=195 /DNA_ID=CAMNT_0025503581 /DNA_START=6 /DNA_END=593 /DNA_ORIENTATION=+